jgi:hypothetical protein
MVEQDGELHLTTVYNVTNNVKTCSYDDKVLQWGTLDNGVKYCKKVRYFESKLRGNIQAMRCNKLLEKCAKSNTTVLYAQYVTQNKVTMKPSSIAEYGRFFVTFDEEYNELMKNQKRSPKSYILTFDDDSQLTK